MGWAGLGWIDQKHLAYALGGDDVRGGHLEDWATECCTFTHSMGSLFLLNFDGIVE
jgi:hypothetical protein